MITLDPNHFIPKKPQLDDYLQDYNGLLSHILSANKGKLKYLASPTLNRMEGQTHLFEKIELFVQVTKALKEGHRVTLSNHDSWIADLLDNNLKSNLIYSKCKKVIFLRTKFVYKLLSLFIANLFISLITKTLIRPKIRYDIIIRSYFDKRCVDPKKGMQDEYFGPLIEDLHRSYSILQAAKLIHLKDVFLYLKTAKESQWPTILIQTILSPKDVLVAFLDFAKCRFQLIDPVLYNGTNITPLINKSINDDYWSFRSLPFFIEHRVARKFVDLSPKVILFPFENQAWEKAYLCTRNVNSPNTKIVGFQHTGVSLKLLNYFPHQNDLDSGFLPDKIVCVGPTIRKFLEENGAYGDKLIVGAALRHEKLMKCGRIAVKMQNTNILKNIVYAFSFDYSKYKKIIHELARLFQNTPITVFLKMHPLFSEEKVISDLNITLPANFILAQSIQWSEIYSQIDCVFYDDNSIGIEAIASGLKTYMFTEAEPIYDINRMFYFDLWDVEVNLGEVLKIKQDIVSGTFKKAFNSNQAEEYLNRYYTPYISGVTDKIFVDI